MAMPDATEIMMKMPRVAGEPPAAAIMEEADEEDDATEAAGFKTVQSAWHCVTGVPLSDPASHSSPRSSIPLPHAAT